MNNVPWFEVLQAAVRTLGYVTVREKHDIIRIVRPEELYKQMDRQVFRLKYLSAPTVYKAQMEEGKYLKGKPVPSPASITDLEKHFTLLEFLRGVLTRDSGGRVLGTLRYDFQTNAIMVTDTKNVLDEIGRILKVLDVEPPQVRIDLKYVSTINEDLLAFGMNYSLGAEEGLTITTQPVPPTRVDAPAATPGAAFNSPFTSGGIGKFTRLPFGLGREPFLSDQYFLTRFDMLAAFRAFKRDRYSKLVQRPTLHVVDNVESTIFVGEEVPYAATQASLTQTGGVVFNIGEGQRSPVKIGFQILVVPKIIRETNQVLLTVIPQNEFLSGTSTELGVVPGFERFSLPGAGIGGQDVQIDLPRISNTTLVTKLMIESGRTVVLGGLVSERTSYEDKKIPLLGDLPLVDFLFKQRNDTVRKENLIIFLTPTIIPRSDVIQEDLANQVREHEERERQSYEELKRRRAAEELRRADEHRMQAEAETFDRIRQGVK
ncbi:MAG: hypothetical protein HY716_02900 [Planctomycetes bacterium]|nr:hypothetical protein [Planctomycetota bacterium]